MSLYRCTNLFYVGGALRSKGLNLDCFRIQGLGLGLVKTTKPIFSSWSQAHPCNSDNAFSIPIGPVNVSNDKASCVQIGECLQRIGIRGINVRDAHHRPVWVEVCDELQESGCKRFDFSLWCGHLCTKSLSV